jgi:hypothetical protein
MVIGENSSRVGQPFRSNERFSDCGPICRIAEPVEWSSVAGPWNTAAVQVNSGAVLSKLSGSHTDSTVEGNDALCGQAGLELDTHRPVFLCHDGAA